MASLKVKLVKSVSGHLPKHRETLRGLGLTRLGMERYVPDTPATRGMVTQVSYLLEWSESPQAFQPFGQRKLRKKAAEKKATEKAD
jgi:large subunit ribosomal protein L30